MKVGVICNINAQRVPPGISARIKAILKDSIEVIEETKKLKDMKQIIDDYFDKVDIWCFVGGDGTVNQGLSYLWYKTGMKDELDIPVLHGKAGSLNAIPDKIPLKGDLDDILIRFKNFLEEKKGIRKIPRDNLKKLNTIKLSIKGYETPKICFNFFLGVPFLISKKVIEMRLGTKSSILQTIYSTIAKFVVSGGREKLIKKIKAEIEIEGAKYPYKFHYVIVGSTFREPALFFRPFTEIDKYKSGFFFFVYSGDAWTAIRNFRTYARGKKRPPHSFNDITSKVLIKAWSGLNYDGEIEDKDFVEFKAEIGPIVNLIKI
jgi:hypothetical protein